MTNATIADSGALRQPLNGIKWGKKLADANAPLGENNLLP